MFPLNELGIYVWALYEAELRKQGFLHEEVLAKSLDPVVGITRLVPAVQRVLGGNFFERMPWEIFPSNRYGRMTWEADEDTPLAVDRVYMEPRGWHELARAMDNEPELQKISWLPQATQAGDWKVWRGKTGFTAISTAQKRTLAGFGRDARDLDQSDLAQIVKDLTPAGARP